MQSPQNSSPATLNRALSDPFSLVGVKERLDKKENQVYVKKKSGS